LELGNWEIDISKLFQTIGNFYTIIIFIAPLSPNFALTVVSL